MWPVLPPGCLPDNQRQTDSCRNVQLLRAGIAKRGPAKNSVAHWRTSEWVGASKIPETWPAALSGILQRRPGAR